MSKPIIILDPGHGGPDPGAGTAPPYESGHVLAFAGVLAAAFEERGCQVRLTRTGDVKTTMEQRTGGTEDAAVFISLHMDGGPATASGPSVWLGSKAPERYMEWGRDVIAGLKGAGITTNRAEEVHRGHVSGSQYDYAVNRLTVPPSMLLELGFATNPDNCREIVSSAQGYAQAIVRATLKFLGLPYPEPVPPAERPAASGPTQDELDHMAQLLAETRQERDAERDRANKAEATIASIKVLIEKHN